MELKESARDRTRPLVNYTLWVDAVITRFFPRHQGDT